MTERVSRHPGCWVLVYSQHKPHQVSQHITRACTLLQGPGTFRTNVSSPRATRLSDMELLVPCFLCHVATTARGAEQKALNWRGGPRGSLERDLQDRGVTTKR